jgi:hypothetical protein
MNKKLLSSSALVSAMLISGAALAEFKVGGDVTATYVLGSHDDSTANANHSDNRIGNETNITFSGKKDLANGLKAAYSGKAEFDRQSTAGSPDHEYELKIGSGDMYVSFANDGGQTNKTMLTPFISYPTSSSANAITPIRPAFHADTKITEVSESNNIGFGGKIGTGNFVVRYAPNADTNAKGNDIDNIDADSTTNGSGMLVAYNGTFNNVGFAAAYTTLQKADDSVVGKDDATEKRVALSYNFGAAKVGIDHIMFEPGTDAIGTGDQDTTILGVAYKVSDAVTVGAYYQETSNEGPASTARDEEIRMLSIGYNLGGASVALNIVDLENNNKATAGQKEDYQGLLITTKVGF